MRRITLVIDIDLDDIEDDIVRPVNVGNRAVRQIQQQFPSAALSAAWRSPEEGS